MKPAFAPIAKIFAKLYFDQNIKEVLLLFLLIISAIEKSDNPSEIVNRIEYALKLHNLTTYGQTV